MTLSDFLFVCARRTVPLVGTSPWVEQEVPITILLSEIIYLLANKDLWTVILNHINMTKYVKENMNLTRRQMEDSKKIQMEFLNIEKTVSEMK